MGCFFGACFGSSKHRKHNNHKVQRNGGSNSDKDQASVSLVQDCSKNAINPIPQLQDKSEEQLSASSKKKVTFDSNVKAYEPVLADGVEEEKSEEGGKKEALAAPKSSYSEDSSVTSTGSYPPNHRYQNCRDSDDEEEEIDYGESDLGDENDDVIREECNESVDDFGEDGIVATTAADHVFVEEVDVKSIGSNSNARDRSVYVHPVLNPVENLTQWKVVKAKRTPPLRPQKENEFGVGVKESPFSLKSESDTSKKLNQEVRVDASLSNWLVSPETTPVSKAGSMASFTGTPDRSTSQGSYSVLSHEDRPILGALTLEEIKQFSATSSPRKSPSRSPDEMPIIGTVGTYWNTAGSAEDPGSVSSFKGIPNSTSKYREDKRVNWHSTPFETRIEKALNRGSASAYVPRVF
ncbi:hypothetical protein VNO78_21923 [Psophocarpus tetragonolobus]|uniref:Protein JASON n=1 Tax=Psophocarpus tetragonolobus TaxID=3891 RepID=A0AAN9XIG0_PSOTE